MYTIFWNPGHLQSGTAVSRVAGYKTLINRWFHDANSSGVWANNKQYTGTNGAPTTTSFGSSWNDKNPFPVNTCTTSHTGGNCISDAAIQQEVANLAAAHSITPSLSKIFFVYTPKGEGSCQTSGTCPDANASYTGYCAYHGNFGTNVIYANMPYPTDVGGSNCYYPKSQNYQTYPNNNINADAVINVTSHEQNEAATDALVSTSPYAWYDAAGYENGDECAWNFAPPTGPNGADTVANGNPYELQQEGSNLASNCVISGPSGP